MQQQTKIKQMTISRARWAALSMLALVAGGIGGCGGGGHAAEPVVQNPDTTQEVVGTVFQGKHFDASLQGAWRVLGEGSMLEIKENSVQQFQETTSFCYEEMITAPGDSLKEMSFRRTTLAGRVSANLYFSADLPATYSLERIAQIPANCRLAPATDALTSFKAMGEIFSLDYSFFKERNIDWTARLAALAPKAVLAKDDDALQAVLIEAVHDFNDPHVNVVRLSAGKPPVVTFNGDSSDTLKMVNLAFGEQTAVADPDAFRAQWQGKLQEAVRSRLSGASNGRVLNGAMAWGQLPGNIGYIELSRLAEFSNNATMKSDLALVRSEMDRALLALADSKAIIVDIALNDGGYDLVGAEVAGSFADMRRLAFTVQQQRPQGNETKSYFVAPRGNKQYLKPVYLLTSDRTISAGDTLTLMMRELPNVTHVGQPTSGAMSNVLAKSLPGNFVVTLSNEKYFDPKGVLYEGRGIPPKVAIEVFKPADRSVLYTSHGAALTELMSIINR